MGFDFIGFTISFLSVYALYVILAVSLNLEYGFAGQPNFGQAMFYGLGAFVAGIATSYLLPAFAGAPAGSICSIPMLIERENLAVANPGLAVGVWGISLVIATLSGAAVGLLASYPALRIKEEWFLSMILLVAAQMFVIIVRNTPQFGCGFNGLPGISNPFSWLSAHVPAFFSADVAPALYAIVLVAFAWVTYRVADKLVNSPYGRLLKTVRDDPTLAEALGKNVHETRKQIMIIGSALAGLAGALYVYYIGVASTEDYTSTLTFTIWVMMILGGYANNKGALIGAFLITLLDRGSLVLGIVMQYYLPSFNGSLVNYGRYMVESVILLLLIVYRPRGLRKEEPVGTPAYSVFAQEKQGEKA